MGRVPQGSKQGPRGGTAPRTRVPAGLTLGLWGDRGQRGGVTGSRPPRQDQRVLGQEWQQARSPCVGSHRPC